MQTNPIEFDFETNHLVFHSENTGSHAVSRALKSVLPIQFKMTCRSPKNSYALKSDFDEMLQEQLESKGFTRFKTKLPSGLKKQSDFSFEIDGAKVVFEIEKANWEKIFYDIFKAHIYLNSGADFFVLMLPLCWGHSSGQIELFKVAKTRFEQSKQFGYGNPTILQKILLVGFNQCFEGMEFSEEVRSKLRSNSAGHFG